MKGSRSHQRKIDRHGGHHKASDSQHEEHVAQHLVFADVAHAESEVITSPRSSRAGEELRLVDDEGRARLLRMTARSFAESETPSSQGWRHVACAVKPTQADWLRR